MKKNIIILVLILLVILSGVVGYKLGFKNKKCNQECNEVVNDKIELNEDQRENFKILSSYGKDIYNTEKYKNLDKDEQGVYYASIKDLEDMEYDVSLINLNCNENTPIIYFDADYKLTNNYTNEPIQYVLNCENNN